MSIHGIETSQKTDKPKEIGRLSFFMIDYDTLIHDGVSAYWMFDGFCEPKTNLVRRYLLIFKLQIQM